MIGETEKQEKLEKLGKKQKWIIYIKKQWTYTIWVCVGCSLFRKYRAQKFIIFLLLYYYYCYIGKNCLDAFVEKMNKIIIDLETFREENDVNDK